MFFRQARGSACKAVVAFYYYSSVRCLISKASNNFFKISNPPQNARFSLFSLFFTQTACYFNRSRIKVLVEALTKILERLATIEVRMILFSISNYSRSLMVMSVSSTPSAKMFKKICPAEVCVFKFFQVCSYVRIQKYTGFNLFLHATFGMLIYRTVIGTILLFQAIKL